METNFRAIKNMGSGTHTTQKLQFFKHWLAYLSNYLREHCKISIIKEITLWIIENSKTGRNKNRHGTVIIEVSRLENVTTYPICTSLHFNTFKKTCSHISMLVLSRPHGPHWWFDQRISNSMLKIKIQIICQKRLQVMLPSHCSSRTGSCL